MKTGFYSDPIFLRHDTGDHPENASRLEAIGKKLADENLLAKLEHRKSRNATEDEIGLIHSIDYMRQVEEAVHAEQPYLGTPDCVLSPETYSVALHATGALLDAVSQVAEGKLFTSGDADTGELRDRDRQQHREDGHNDEDLDYAETPRAPLGQALDGHWGSGTQLLPHNRKTITYLTVFGNFRTTNCRN